MIQYWNTRNITDNQISEVNLLLKGNLSAPSETFRGYPLAKNHEED